MVQREDTNKHNNALWYLNGQVVDPQVLSAINPDKIADVKAEKGRFEFNEVFYDGSIRIVTAEDYQPKLISLTELKAKYLNIADGTSTLFLLDGEVVNRDYDEFKVDEGYLFKIEVQVVENRQENLDITIVRLITRTKENLEKANTIRIRGADARSMN